MVALVLDGLVGFPAGLSPTSFHMSPTSFHLSPWVLVVGFAAGLSPTCIHLSPTSFHLPPNSFHLSLRPLPFICLPLLFIVSQAGCLWSGSGPACLPLPFICLPLLFICLPGWVLVVGFAAGLSPTSFHLPPRLGRLGACGRVHFLSFVSQARCLWSGSRPACLPLPFICLPLLFCLWSGSRPACLPLPLICLSLLFICHPLLFICLPGWVLVVGFPARLSPACFHLSPGSFHLSPRNASFVSQVRHAM